MNDQELLADLHKRIGLDSDNYKTRSKVRRIAWRRKIMPDFKKLVSLEEEADSVINKKKKSKQDIKKLGILSPEIDKLKELIHCETAKFHQEQCQDRLQVLSVVKWHFEIYKK